MDLFVTVADMHAGQELIVSVAIGLYPHVHLLTYTPYLPRMGFSRDKQHVYV